MNLLDVRLKEAVDLSRAFRDLACMRGALLRFGLPLELPGAACLIRSVIDERLF